MSQAQWALAVAQAEESFTNIAKAAGNLVAYEREASFALQIIQGSTYLQGCTHESLRNAVTNVAAIGLSLSPALKLAYLVPRKGKACLDISYIGLVKIATDSGAVQAVHATIVRGNDQFRYIDAFTNPEHVFDPFATAEARGAVIGSMRWPSSPPATPLSRP
jgi:recombination protein RecT